MVSKETFTYCLLLISIKILNAFQTIKKGDIYDYYYISLRHIKGICIERPCKFYQSSLNWTLHGLWPNKFNNQHPSFCNRSSLDMALFPINLKEKMEKFWRNLYHSSSLSFYRNQWEKHGSCIDDPFYNSNDLNKKLFFFTKAVSLMEEYNPSNYYQNDHTKNGLIDPIELQKAIQDKYRTEFFLECQLDKETGRKYVTKMRIPLDKNFGLMRNFKSPNKNC